MTIAIGHLGIKRGGVRAFFDADTGADLWGQIYPQQPAPAQTPVYDRVFAQTPTFTPTQAPVIQTQPFVPAVQPQIRVQPQITMPNTALGMANASPNFITTPTPFMSPTAPTLFQDSFSAPATRQQSVMDTPAQEAPQIVAAPHTDITNFSKSVVPPVGVPGAPGTLSGEVDATSFVPQPAAPYAAGHRFASVDTGALGDTVATGATTEDGSPATEVKPPTVDERIDALKISDIANAAISPDKNQAQLLALQKSIADLGPAPTDPAKLLEHNATLGSLKTQIKEIEDAIGGRAKFEVAFRTNLRLYPELLAAVESAGEKTPTAIAESMGTALQDRLAPAMKIPGLIDAATTAQSNFSSVAGTFVANPGTAESLFKSYNDAVSATAKSVETHLADSLGVPTTPTGPGGVFSQSDLNRIETGIGYMKENGLDSAFPSVMASLEARKTRAADAVAVSNGTASVATKMLSEFEVAHDALYSKFAHGEEAKEAAEAGIVPLRTNFKLQVEAIKASGKTEAQQKADIAAAALDFDRGARSVIAQIGRTERPSNNPLRNSTYASDGWNWEGIMAAGGLALALYAPFERRQAQRDAEAREDELWEKQKAWQREMMALQNDYRLQQIEAAGEASSGKGTPSGTQVARF